MRYKENSVQIVATRISIFLILISVLFLVFVQPANAESMNKKIYAVFWRGCEELCHGFQDYIKERNLNAEIVIRDAAGDKTRLPGFLEEARAINASLILTWGTSVTLGMTGTLDDINDSRYNNEIPHVFTVVADPVGAQIVESLDRTGRQNITGTFNRVPESVNISTIRSYMPTFKRLGLLYNTNEPNSVLKFKKISELAKEMDFELTALQIELNSEGLPKVENIAVKMRELKDKKVDFIYLGSSSFLDSNRDIFTGLAVDNGIPVLSPYERLVRESQALLSIAASYYELGKIAGAQVEKILVDGIMPGELPVAKMTNFAYVVNMEVARKLNIFPSVAILQIAETVH